MSEFIFTHPEFQLSNTLNILVFQKFFQPFRIIIDWSKEIQQRIDYFHFYFLLFSNIFDNHIYIATQHIMIADCLILGDSIAVGVAQNLPQCEMVAKVGLNTDQMLRRSTHWISDTVIISLGSNDNFPIPIEFDILRKFRKTIESKRVFWIMPNINPAARAIIREIARDYGDFLIDAHHYDKSPDRIHPTAKGYREIARSIPVLK